ncbi:DUF2029 domain-containing protein [Shouchella lonarensis]|uniref:DUF2029 domain-containing protein n=1 Tax=Shouchella lonarensis TaxID=1464122 RepID=UPI00114D4937|nr:DUF2029 domain-containing protein [Shouchella lonarensis]
MLAILLLLSYFIISAGLAYLEYRFSRYEQIGTNLLGVIACAWSLVAINLYGIQALVDQPFYQGVYINLLWGQLALILFAWITWVPVRTRKLVARGVTIALGAFLLFHGLGVLNSTRGSGSGIYVALFGQDAAVALILPGVALFFSGFWTRFVMGVGIDFDITAEEHERMVAEWEARREASKRKISEEMLSSGRYLEYGELVYPMDDFETYRKKGSKTYEHAVFLYVENGVRYFSRMDCDPAKEMILYQENGEWYCKTSGEEPEPVLLPEWPQDKTEEEMRGFEDDKREYLERAIVDRAEVPHFVELPDDIDESKIKRY